MKKLSLLLTAFLLTVLTYAQDAASKGYLEAYIEPSGGMISYRKFGEITKDGILLIDMKTTALNNFVDRTKPDAAQMDLVEKEKQDLEKLRQRILIQRERMIQPVPPMDEVH